MKRARKFVDKLLKDGSRADVFEYALVASFIVLMAVALEGAVMSKIGNEFNTITNRF